MDWLQGMNRVITHIEDNLQEPIPYESLSRIVGCSVYEFSRIFSFMAGISVSEYIRRRRLSQAVFDIRNTGEKIIDIALRYGYESPNTFARAFKDLHGTTPTDARHANVTLKTYPPISFILSIKGVNEMQFRIEKTEATTLYGARMGINPSSDISAPTIHQSHKGVYLGDGVKRYDNNEEFEARFPSESDPGKSAERKSNFDKGGYIVVYDVPGRAGWQGDKTLKVTAYDFGLKDGILWYLVGGEAAGDTFQPDVKWKTQELPPAIWAVFPVEGFSGPSKEEALSLMYARIQTEWFPASGYRRDETIPHLEVSPAPAPVIGENIPDGPLEIWMPVLKK